MSFFGITALGPQNSFQTHLINAIGLNIFTPEEFKAAFDRIDKDKSGYIDIDEVRTLLRETYGMDPLEEEVAFFMEEFDANRDGRISWQEFISALNNILGDLEARARRAKQLSSFDDLTFKRRKHIRSNIAPHEVYIRPLTYGQGYGFFDFEKARKLPTATQKTFYKSSCAETKYADNLISGGHH
ncbi:unnamed protein product [Blepharisma stoltei]|uniref:EF-hand domain-containing protein n=1 Tax=Blepharisma stoltei TaxID=1481888 RepID=A0AAU9K3S4_9CILI|nr:unnamed protein product [Blepharisma stoltei]